MKTKKLKIETFANLAIENSKLIKIIGGDDSINVDQVDAKYDPPRPVSHDLRTHVVA